MALDKKPDAVKAGTIQFDTVNGTILLTALQKKTASAAAAELSPEDKKEDR